MSIFTRFCKLSASKPLLNQQPLRALLSTNIQVKLAQRPVGLPDATTWDIVHDAAPTVSPNGGILVRVEHISLDPAMRGWLNEARSYIKPVAIGDVMRAIGSGTVIASNNPNFAVGDTVLGGFGVQQYAAIPEPLLPALDVTKIQVSSFAAQPVWLSALGMPGMTAFFGLKDIGQPKTGETIVVSAASGAVGQTVGQLAKIYGMRVVGIAGGQAKCDWVVNTLGFDACIDYKSHASSIREGLKSHCPGGIDVYFDNVGGDTLDTVLARINKKARIIICGAISQYNNTSASQMAGPKNYLSLLVNRAKMEGMVVFDYKERYPEAIVEMGEYLEQGKMVSREHIVEGIENFPDALNLLFSGGNFGKLVLKV